MIKGRATIQIIDEKSGETLREIHEENMITNAVDTILNPPDYIESGMDAENDRSYNPLRDFLGNLADTAFRGVIVCRDKIPEDGNNMMLPWTNEEVGHAGISNTNTDTTIGTYNQNESGRIENGKGYRHVWDFASDKANGEITATISPMKKRRSCGRIGRTTLSGLLISRMLSEIRYTLLLLRVITFTIMFSSCLIIRRFPKR